MPDLTKKDGLNTYYCGRCGEPITNTRRLHLQLPASNLFGDKIDYILICEACGREIFPKTTIFDRDDIDE